MAFCDFVIKYNPAVDTSETLTRKILYSVIVKRIKAKKPAVIFLGGDSGEGKSYSAIRFQQLLLEIQGLDIYDYFDDINVYTPLEYAEKLDRVLNEKRLKKVNIISIHEAREVVKAKRWQSFLTQAVADINAMSRSIKRLCIIIISQFIRDITTDIRYTLNYYMIVRRPKGKAARVYINVLWKDDRDLEKPRLRKRKLSGYLVYPNGKYRRFVPQYLEFRQPDKELRERFDKADMEAKSSIIRHKLERLINEMKLDIDLESKKIEAMVNYYVKHTDNLHLIGKLRKDRWKVTPQFREMHDLTKEESMRFEGLLNEKLKSIGAVEDGKEQERV